MDISPDYTYGKAVTDYWVDEASQELSVFVDDVVRVIRKEGRRQVHAVNLLTGKEGLLPTYCIVPLRLPDDVELTNENLIFFALRDFYGAEQGDLNFTKGKSSFRNDYYFYLRTLNSVRKISAFKNGHCVALRRFDNRGRLCSR